MPRPVKGLLSKGNNKCKGPEGHVGRQQRAGRGGRGSNARHRAAQGRPGSLAHGKHSGEATQARKRVTLAVGHAHCGKDNNTR